MLQDIKPTNLIKHSINLKPNIYQLYLKIFCYTQKNTSSVIASFQK